MSNLEFFERVEHKLDTRKYYGRKFTFTWKYCSIQGNFREFQPDSSKNIVQDKRNFLQKSDSSDFG